MILCNSYKSKFAIVVQLLFYFASVSCYNVTSNQGQLSVSDGKAQMNHNNVSILCYSNLDKSKVVHCAGQCVFKIIINENAVKGQQYKVRIGCEQKSAISKLRELNCQRKSYATSETNSYIIHKSLGNYIFINKKCCKFDLCNIPKIPRTEKEMLKPKMDIEKTNREIASEWYLFPLSILIAVFGTILFVVMDFIESRLKFFSKTYNDYKCGIDDSILKVNEFNEAKLVDTSIEASGQLKLFEVSEILALLPEYSRRESSSVTKSHSTEEVGVSATPNRTSRSKEGGSQEIDDTPKKVRIERPLFVSATGYGHNLFGVYRVTNSPFDLLYRLIEHGPYSYPFTALELLQLFEETSYRFSEESSLLKISSGVTVIGDIRGRYADLHRWLQLTGWPPNNKLLFLGGVIDNDERGSIECLALICALKCRFPTHVYMIRGIPESEPFEMSKRFHPRICMAIQSCIARMCSNLPFAAIIGNSVLGVYSGFSPMIREKDHISSLFRPVSLNSYNQVEIHLIYNQPSDNVRMYRPNTASRGDWFGRHAVTRACRALGVCAIVRAQSIVPFGYLPCWDRRLLNIWSAPGKGDDYGAILHISDDMRLTPIVMRRQKTSHKKKKL